MTTFCPNCVTPVDVDESPFADVVCPACEAIVRQAPRANSKAGKTAGWEMTSFALKTEFGILGTVLFISAGVLLFPAPGGDVPVFLCVGVVLLLVWFLCVCLSATAPEPAVRRSALACVLTIVLGTLGLIGFSVFARWNAIGVPVPVSESVLAVGMFAVSISAFVFLMRFHATIARVFGNRRLLRQCYVYMAAPLIAFGVNLAFLSFTQPQLGRPFRPGQFLPRDLGAFLQAVFNFALVGWYAMIQWQTFRTIDRGPVVEQGGIEDHEDEDSLG